MPQSMKSNSLMKSCFLCLNIIKYGFLFAHLRDKKDAQSMLDGVVLLDSIIGSDLFHNKVQILLTDRGSEFTAAETIETRAAAQEEQAFFIVILCNRAKRQFG